MKTLRATVATAQAARDVAERRIREKPNPSGGGAVEDQGKIAQAENRAAKAETELAQMQKEKADLQTKLDENLKEITSLQTPVKEAEKNPNVPVADSPATAPTTDLESQVDDLRRQLDSAEKEKAFLSEKLQDIQDRADQPKEGKKRRETVRETAPRRQVCAGRSLRSIRLQLRGIESRHAPRSRVECGDACSAGWSVGRKNSHFFS
jgi:Chromosome segregation ATPases